MLMTKILLTGATGYIGSALIALLAKENFKLIALVRNVKNDLPSYVEQRSISNASCERDLGGIFNDIDIVIHLAARVHTMSDSAVNPLSEFRKVNTVYTIDLATAAAASNVKRFVFLSTIKVNGEETKLNLPFNQSSFSLDPACEKLRISDPYAVSKYEAEQGLIKISQNNSMEIVILRPPLVYGPKVKGNFNLLLKLVQKNFPLPFGKIQNQRSMIALGNLLDLIKVSISHPAAANQVFLASDDHDVSTTELFLALGRVMGTSIVLIPIYKRVLYIGLILVGKKAIAQRLLCNLQIDISKTKELLDWSPPISVEDALQQTVRDWD